MSDMFTISAKDMLKLQKRLKQDPKKFQFAAASMLNSFAFGTRDQSNLVINSEMTVRNKRFVKGKLKVEMAKGSEDINVQSSAAGSISGPRFSGWAEQELGTTTKRTRVGNKFGRGGDWNKQLQGQARLKPNQNFLDPSDLNIKAKDDTHRITVFLNIISRRKKKQSFIIPKKYKKFKKGLYRFKGGKIQQLQNFEPKKTQPKRIKFLTMGREQYFSKTNISQLWNTTMKRIFR